MMGEEGILATGETVEVTLEGKDGIHQAVFEGIGAADGGSAPVLVLRIDDDLYDWPLAEVAITQTE
jgi:hypothetical protein